MKKFIMPAFEADLEHPSKFVGRYYNKLVQLVKLGVLNFGVSVLSPEQITAEALNGYYDDSRRFGKHPCDKTHSKLSGVIAAEHFRQEMEMVLRKHNAPYKLSQNNAYIQGCHIEFDFLLLKQDAEPMLDVPVYRLCDVVAILECKTNGVYAYKESSLERMFRAYFEDLDGIRNQIRIGYMTMSENCPKNEAGNSNFIRHTIEDFESRFEHRDDLWNCYFARCHYDAKKPDCFMSDAQWEQFVLSMLPKQ